MCRDKFSFLRNSVSSTATFENKTVTIVLKDKLLKIFSLNVLRKALSYLEAFVSLFCRGFLTFCFFSYQNEHESEAFVSLLIQETFLSQQLSI